MPTFQLPSASVSPAKPGQLTAGVAQFLNPGYAKQTEQSALGFLPRLNAGPQNAFSDADMQGFDEETLKRLGLANWSTLTGAQNAGAARGAGGPNLATMLNPQQQAQTRGDLAGSSWQANLAGKQLGLQDYNALTGAYGQTANNFQGQQQLALQGQQMVNSQSNTNRQNQQQNPQQDPNQGFINQINQNSNGQVPQLRAYPASPFAGSPYRT